MSRRKTPPRQSKRAQATAEVLPRPRDRGPAELAWLCVAVVLLAGAIWAVYGRAVSTPLIFDDKVSIIGNTSIQQLWPLWGDAEQPGPLRPPHHSPVAGRPLVNLTLAANYHFGQLDPAGYHVLNIWLHVLTAVLVFAVVRRTLRLPYFGDRFARATDPLSLAVALLWALHPLQTESVIYVTQRTELMVGFCYLATLYGSLRYWSATTPGRRATWLGLTVLAALAGMASKEVMVSAPVVVLLLERTLVAGSFREAWRRSWPLYVGLAATWGLLLALNVNSPRGDSAGFHLGLPVVAWWFTQAKVLWMYLKLVVWPWPLSIHYDMPYETAATAWPWMLGVVALAVGALVLLWRGHPVGFLGAWMAAVLAPTFVVPITTEVAAERRMYVPLVALAALVVVGGYWLLQQLAQRLAGRQSEVATRRALVAAAGCVTVLLVVGAGIASAHRLAIYDDPLALWQDTVAAQPLDPMAYYNLGVALADRDRLQEAIACYRRAVELKPNYGSAHYNLGNLLARSGHTQEAIDEYQQALHFHPNDADAQFNLGLILAGAGRQAEAIEQYERVLELQPDKADVHAELGYVLTDVGRDTEAIVHLQRATELKPDDAHVAYCYGSALLKTGQTDQAIGRFQHALELDPDYADAHNNLAAALASVGKIDEAIEQARRAVELEPKRADARSNLGTLLLGAGRNEEAVPEFRAALDLDPGMADAHGNLAGALRRTGQFKEAIDQYQQAMRLAPDNLAILGGLAEVYLQTDQADKAIALTEEAIRVARAKGENELADKIEAWLTQHQSGLADSTDTSPTADGSPDAQ